MTPVPTSCRAQLHARDFEFIASVLTGSALKDSAIESLLADPETLDAVLERPQLFQAVIELPSPLSISPLLYFYVLVRHSLRDAGIDDREVADYVAATLAEHATGISPLGRKTSKPTVDFNYHIDFIKELDGLSDSERFFLHVHCGNHFLVTTGLFPSFLRNRCERRGAPGVRYYEGVARDAFLAAGEHPLATEYAVSEIYDRLAGQFGETRRALNRMAEDFLFLGS